MSQAIADRASLVRVTVVGENRRLDVGIPSQLPLIELIPGFARSLGVLDPTLAHGGYALHRSDGSVLDPARGAGAQGVRDGDLVTLVHGELLREPKVYDDIVEAVIDASADQHRAWTARDSARTALAISMVFLALCAVVLLAAGPALGVGALIAGGGAVVLVATAAVVSRVGEREAGLALGLAAAAFGGLSGYLAAPVGVTGRGAEDLWGWPLASAALGLVIVGSAAFAFTPGRAEVHLVPIVLGVAVGIPALVTATLVPSAVGPYALTVAIAGTLGGTLPWLALSSTRIRAISPQSDAEVFAAPSPIDADRVRARAGSGQRVLIALRIATGLTVLAATPLVAGSGGAGALLTALAFAGMMFQSRQTFARGGVVVLMTLGAAGLAITGLTVVLRTPALITATLVVTLVATVALVALTLVAPRARVRLARLADAVELVVLAALLPIGVIAAGLAG